MNTSENTMLLSFDALLNAAAERDRGALNGLLSMYKKQRSLDNIQSEIPSSEMQKFYKGLFSSGDRTFECSVQKDNYIFHIQGLLDNNHDVVVYIGHQNGTRQSYNKIKFGIIQDGQGYIIK